MHHLSILVTATIFNQKEFVSWRNLELNFLTRMKRHLTCSFMATVPEAERCSTIPRRRRVSSSLTVSFGCSVDGKAILSLFLSSILIDRKRVQNANQNPNFFQRYLFLPIYSRQKAEMLQFIVHQFRLAKVRKTAQKSPRQSPEIGCRG